MAVTVEELVVSLGLDAEKLKNGAQEAAQALQPVKGIVDDINKSIKDLQSGFDVFRNWNRALSGGMGLGGKKTSESTGKTSSSRKKSDVPEYSAAQVYGAGKSMPEIYGMIPSYRPKDKVKERKTTDARREKERGDFSLRSILKDLVPGLAGFLYIAKDIVGVFGNIASKIFDISNAGKEMSNVARRLEFDTKNIQAFGIASERSGYSAKNATKDLEHLITGIPAIATGNIPELIKAFPVPTHDVLTGKMRPTEAILKDLFNVIQLKGKEGHRELARIANQTGVSMDFMVTASKGWEEFVRNRIKYEKEGAIVGKNVTDQLFATNIEMMKLKETLSAMSLTLVAVVSQFGKGFLTDLQNMFSGFKGSVLDPMLGDWKTFTDSFKKMLTGAIEIWGKTGPMAPYFYLKDFLTDKFGNESVKVPKTNNTDAASLMKSPMNQQRSNDVPQNVTIGISGLNTPNPSVTWNGNKVEKTTLNSYMHPITQ